MGCNSSKAGLIFAHTNKHPANGSNGLPHAKGSRNSSGTVVVPAGDIPRKLSLPGETIPHRRRLSVVHIDGTGVADENVDRGMVRMLDNKAALDFFNEDPESKKWSIATETDVDLHRRASFGDKSVNAHGTADFDGYKHGIGYACKKGLKPVSPNQDSFFILKVEGGVGVYGVFDGHGRGGHDVSNFVKDVLPKLIVSHPGFHDADLTETLTYAFHETQKLLEHQTKLGVFNASTSGTTGTVVVFRPPNTVWVAHVGDSRCVLGIQDNVSKKLRSFDITGDHKPELSQEYARIISSGGSVIKPPMDLNHRVYVKGQKYPGLAMSRSLGDLVGYRHAGISCTPDVSCYSLNFMTTGAFVKDKVTMLKTPHVSPVTVLFSNSHPETIDANHQGHKSAYSSSDDEDENMGKSTQKRSIHSDSEDDDSQVTTIPLPNENGTGSSPNDENRSPNMATKPPHSSQQNGFILLCSDGVWEFISSHEAVKIAAKFVKSKAPVAAEELAKVSWDRWMIEENGHVVDDITALVLHL